MIPRRRLAVALSLLACLAPGCQDGEIRLTSGVDVTERDASTSDAGAGAPGAPDATTGDDAGTSPDAAALPDAHGCSGDNDCPLASLHCDLASGQCVPCVRDDQCTKPGFPRCDLAQHRCVECGVSSDCADGGVCDPATLRCAVPCHDGGCAGDDVVCGSHGYCSSCEGDAASCGGQSVCDDDNGMCGECSRDSQCPSAKPHCDRTRDVCVQCRLSSDCPASAPKCDPATWSCAP